MNGTIFEKEKISLDKPKFARKFCLNETDNSIFPGITNIYGECVKVSVFDISDLENTQKVSDFSRYCNDPEMQKRFDDAQRPINSVYLGCKNGTFKVTENGLQKVNGSKNCLREGYVYDGILYQVFSGTLHLSSLKTEEIQEDGWF